MRDQVSAADFVRSTLGFPNLRSPTEPPRYMQDGVTPTPSDFTDGESPDEILNSEPVTDGVDVDNESDDSFEKESTPEEGGDKYVLFSFIRHGEVCSS